jgi:ABC-2 type transport system permease protein
MTLTALWGHLRRMLAVAHVEVLHLVWDPTTVSLILLVPAIQIVLFGYAINLDPKQVPIAIAGDYDRKAEKVRATIERTGYFMIVADGLRPGIAERMVVEGKVRVGIEIPAANSDSDILAGQPRIVVDAVDPSAVRPALAALENAYWRQIAELYAIGPVPSPDVEWLYNPEGRTSWTIVPGLAGVVVMISMLMLGALTLVRERERGSWETLLATPVDAIDALVGKLAPYVVIGTVQAAVVFYLARLLFHLPLKGNILELLLALPLYGSAYLILGFAFSAVAESQLQAIQGAVFFYLPSMLLSGFMFPFEGMPKWARVIGEALPLTHFVRATRCVFFRGQSGSLVLSEMMPVAVFALIASTFALLAYRSRID